jgi:uracil-DNA glycosylase
MSDLNWIDQIEEKENALFKDWEKHEDCLYRDGVRQPKLYGQTRIKTVFVLREGNFGGEARKYDFRSELLHDPPPFWKCRVFPWSYGLSHHDIGSAGDLWKRLKAFQPTNDEVYKTIDNFGYIQLKKRAGGSTSKPDELIKATKQRPDFLYKQFKIYRPDVIVACGTGAPKTYALLQEFIFKSRERDSVQFSQHYLGETGRHYAKIIDKNISPRPIFMIESYHPSHRKSREAAFSRLVTDYQLIVKSHFTTR